MSDIMNLSRADYKDLHEHYIRAVESGAETFTWRGRELLVNYAKYLLEYLDLQFK